LQAVHPGQHQVEDDEARLVVAEELLGTDAVCRFERLVALALQVAHDDVPDDRFIVDDEHGRHPEIVPVAALRNGEFESPKALERAS
jgi:hypothetical protein